MKILLILSVVAVATYFIVGCATSNAPLPNAGKVDLKGFMGTWYVLGYTPLGIDGGAHNAIEHYYLSDSGDIETTYQFRKESFEGELKTLTPVGQVHDKETNAEWRMQFVWPFKAEYVIFDLSTDGQRTIIAHPNRKYAWIMARTPQISDSQYETMVGKLQAEGFDPAVIQKVPHDWSDETERLERIREAGQTDRLVTE